MRGVAVTSNEEQPHQLIPTLSDKLNRRDASWETLAEPVASRLCGAGIWGAVRSFRDWTEGQCRKKKPDVSAPADFISRGPIAPGFELLMCQFLY